MSDNLTTTKLTEQLRNGFFISKAEAEEIIATLDLQHIQIVSNHFDKLQAKIISEDENLPVPDVVELDELTLLLKTLDLLRKKPITGLRMELLNILPNIGITLDSIQDLFFSLNLEELNTLISFTKEFTPDLIRITVELIQSNHKLDSIKEIAMQKRNEKLNALPNIRPEKLKILSKSFWYQLEIIALQDADKALESILLLSKQERIDALISIKQALLYKNAPPLIRFDWMSSLTIVKENALKRIQEPLWQDRATLRAIYNLNGLGFFQDGQIPLANVKSQKFIDTLLKLPVVVTYNSYHQLSYGQIQSNTLELGRGFNFIYQGRSLESANLHLNLLPEPSVVDVMTPYVRVGGAIIFGLFALRALRLARPLQRTVSFFVNQVYLNKHKNDFLVRHIINLPDEDKGLEFLTDAQISDFKNWINTINDPELKSNNEEKLNRYKNYLNDRCSISQEDIVDIINPITITASFTPPNQRPYSWQKTFQSANLVNWIENCSLNSELATEPETRDSLIASTYANIKIKKGYPMFVGIFVKIAKTAIGVVPVVPAASEEAHNIDIETDSEADSQLILLRHIP